MSATRGLIRPRSSRPPTRPGPGSYRLLDWVARLGAAGIEPAGIVLDLSRGTVYCHARRLVDAGLMWRVPVNDGGGGIIAVTPRGASWARERGIAAVAPRSQAPSSGVHARGVSWVAARAELKGWRWLGPAELAEDGRWTVRREDRARHRPDLGIAHDGTYTAVEVELHAKSPDRLRAILRAYRLKIDVRELSGCTYVVDKTYVERLVKREIAAAGFRTGVTVGRLEQLIEMARKDRSREHAA